MRSILGKKVEKIEILFRHIKESIFPLKPSKAKNEYYYK